MFHTTWKDPGRDEETQRECAGKKKAIAGVEYVLSSTAQGSLMARTAECMQVQLGKEGTLVLGRSGFIFFLCVISGKQS